MISCFRPSIEIVWKRFKLELRNVCCDLLSFMKNKTNMFCFFERTNYILTRNTLLRHRRMANSIGYFSKRDQLFFKFLTTVRQPSHYVRGILNQRAALFLQLDYRLLSQSATKTKFFESFPQTGGI